MIFPLRGFSFSATNPAVKRPAEGQALQPTALIVGFPWLRSGSGKVFEAQMEYFRSRGWKALFIAVPQARGETRGSPIWGRFAAQASELPYFPYLIQTFNTRVRKAKSLGGLRFWKSDKTSLDFNFQISSSVEPDQELNNFIASNDVRIIVGNHVYTSPFCLKLKDLVRKYNPDVRLATVTHDVQSYIAIDNERKNPWTREKDSVDLLLARELDMLSRSDSLIHVSDDDLQFFSEKLPQKSHFLALPPIVEKEIPVAAAETDLLFVGSQHVANSKALQWYFREAVPHFVSEPSLAILGTVSNLMRKGEELWAERAHYFRGSVPDPTPYYAQSRAVLAPMVSGRGISIKTIEALAYGKPVVGTRLAFRGIPDGVLREHGIQYWDDPADFAKAATAMLSNLDEHRERGRRLYRALFTLDRFAASMTEALHAAGIRV